MYISLNSVLEAFLHCRHNTDNKFWGLVAILHAIGEKIVPGVSYTINTKDVSNALEQLFTQLSQVNFPRSNSAYSCTNIACRCEFPQMASRISSL